MKVVEASNQSMGFCPDIECWSAVASALALRGVELPKGWTPEITFRRWSGASTQPAARALMVDGVGGFSSALVTRGLSAHAR
ncbi:MAG: hypothetical protein Q8N23_35895 [Archangium sp.]|nr:hypothetical protein [Archangium sp.]MDP3570483.1 hypothetical protein [Archangium sp.]